MASVVYSVTDADNDMSSVPFTITIQATDSSNQDQTDGGNNGNDGNNNNGNGNNNNGNNGNNNNGNNGNNNGGNNNGGNNGNGNNNNGNSGSKSNSGKKKSYTPPPPPPSPSPSQQQQSSPDANVPVAITTPYLLNVRSGPGLDYDVITTVPLGTRAKIYGIDPQDDWFMVEIEGITGQVWIYQDLTTVEGSLLGVRRLAQWEIDLLPGPGTEGDGPLAITTPVLLNVRSGPGLDYDILTTVPQGTQGRIIGLSPDSLWYKVELGVLDQPAWIYAGLTTLVSSLVGVKVYTLAELDGTDTGADKPLAITVPTILNVRSGPGTEYEVVTTVPQGTQAGDHRHRAAKRVVSDRT